MLTTEIDVKLAIVPIAAPVPRVHTCRYAKCEDSAKKSTCRHEFTNLFNGVAYVIGTSPSPITKATAKAHGITQLHMTYRDFKRMEYNTYCHRVSDTVIPLPAPSIAGLLPANAQHVVRVGDTVAIAGFSQSCTVKAIEHKFDAQWATVTTRIGSHPMTRTVLYSSLAVRP